MLLLLKHPPQRAAVPTCFLFNILPSSLSTTHSTYLTIAGTSFLVSVVLCYIVFFFFFGPLFFGFYVYILFCLLYFLSVIPFFFFQFFVCAGIFLFLVAVVFCIFVYWVLLICLWFSIFYMPILFCFSVLVLNCKTCAITSLFVIVICDYYYGS